MFFVRATASLIVFVIQRKYCLWHYHKSFGKDFTSFRLKSNINFTIILFFIISSLVTRNNFRFTFYVADVRYFVTYGNLRHSPSRFSCILFHAISTIFRNSTVLLSTFKMRLDSLFLQQTNCIFLLGEYM